jgi:uncharacterized protein DUF3180
MTRTKPSHLLVLFVAGAGLTWLLETALAASGNAVLVPPLTLPVALALIGVMVVIMALPVRRVSRGVPNARVDPFYATQVVMLAKASSLSAALLVGGGLGIAGYLLTRAVPTVGSVALASAAAGGALVLLVGGLLGEFMCKIPPDDDSKADPTPGPQGPKTSTGLP